jgi:FKBP-type peptidyl-prolyl cis-trans isomerase
MENKIKKVSPIIIVIILFLAFSCDDSKKYEEQEQATIQAYLEAHTSVHFDLKPSGLYYYEAVTGTGRTPKKSDTVYVKYTGKLLNGTVFDTNVGDADSLKYPALEGWLIDGFEESISYMKAGGKSTAILPSSLAYGPNGNGNIWGYTPLLFEIELCKVKPGPNK